MHSRCKVRCQTVPSSRTCLFVVDNFGLVVVHMHMDCLKWMHMRWRGRVVSGGGAEDVLALVEDDDDKGRSCKGRI